MPQMIAAMMLLTVIFVNNLFENSNIPHFLSCEHARAVVQHRANTP